MLLTLDYNNIDINNIILCEPINNTVIENSKFIRLIYSDKNIIMNGIYIKLSIHISNIEHAYNKLRCYVDYEKNRDICKGLILIENTILSKTLSNKTPAYKLTECLNKGIIKIFSENYSKPHFNSPNKEKYNNERSISLNKNTNNNSQYNIILKISGIWADERDYGLTYKFITL